MLRNLIVTILIPTQQSVKAYVDTQLTAEDLDFAGDSGGDRL